ncbi:MAG: hypothetical protein JW795_18805 [Chitinivibrionales bacterium]|nr:hypothetical protein [Chitinivibrionales bacterium]
MAFKNGIIIIIGFSVMVTVNYYCYDYLKRHFEPVKKIANDAEMVSSQDFTEFLRQNVINNPTPPLPQSHYQPGPALDWQIISHLFNQRKFAELNSLFEATQKGQTISEQGIPNIWDQGDLGFEVSDEKIVNDYCLKFPDSPWPYIVRGEFYVWYAWEARGTGYASTVTSEGWNLLYQRLEQALHDYQNAAKIRPDLVHAYAGGGLAAMYSGHQQTALRLYTKALSLDPADWESLSRLFEHSKSKWYGPNDSLMFEFARAIATKHPEYPYLLRLTIMAHEEMAWRHADGDGDKARNYLCQPSVWNEIIDLYKNLNMHYPESNYVKKNFRQTAAWAGKKDEVLKLLR